MKTIYGFKPDTSTGFFPICGADPSRYVSAMTTIRKHEKLIAPPGTLAARVLTIAAQDGRAPAAIAKAAGLNEGFIRDLVRRPHQSPTLAKIEKLADELQVAPEWIAFGRDSGEAANPPQGPLHVLGEVAAGVWREADAAQPDIQTTIFSDPRFPFEAQYLLLASGTSMNNVILPGDLVHCVAVDKGGPKPNPTDIVIVERRRAGGEREVSAKRFLDRKGGAIFMADSNDPKWENFVLSNSVADGEAISLLALVIRAIRKFV